ncbi:MAG: InlB B-repeat-containing protein, partial [Clostridiales bacterium]|nr:InlB B-repeat-containing protein [Clostridiales bacterium]
MKKLHRFLYIVTIALVISAIAMFVAACSGTEEPAPPKQYTLTFKLDENTDYDSYTGVKGSEVTRKPDPTDATARFEGWSTEPNGAIVEVPTVMPEEDRTYYAVFARYYNITLNAGAGTLDDAQKRLESKAEQSIYSIVKDVVPTAPGSAEFDGWYYNNVKLTAESKDVMPAKNIALDAKYSIGYTVNIHVQEKFGEDGEYKEDASKKIVGKGLVGATVRTSEYPKLDGYEINDEKSGDTEAFVLNATSNIFNIYYGKTGYSVMFAGNAPEENLTVKGDAINEQWGYGDVHTMPECPYTISGYRFSYWSENSDGSGKKYYVGDEYSVQSTTMIYAVWVKGYVDSSGMSPDIVYLDETKDGKKVAYLTRTYNEEIVGSYTKQSDGAYIFFFNDGSGPSPTIKGAALPDSNKFIYYMDDAYVLRYIGKAEDTFMNALNRDVTLTIPMMDTVVNKRYTAVYKDGSTEITGSYSYEEEQNSLKFTSENKEFYFRLSQTIAGDTGLTQNVFEIRGDEYGMWHSMNAQEEVDAHYNIVLDGYGTAQMIAVGLDSTYSKNVTTTTNGIYRYTANYTKEKREIAVAFTASSGRSRSFVCMLLDGKNYGTATTPIEKVYVERSVTVVYAKPEGDNALDIETADRFELDGYGLNAESAKLISGTTETAGKYFFDASTLSYINQRPLQFTFTPNGGDEVTYELSYSTVGDLAYYVYEAVDKTLYGEYAIYGLEPTFTPGQHYKLRIYNNGKAEMVLAMPYQSTIYGNIYWDYLTVASGKIEEEGEEYHFVGDLDSSLVFQSYLFYYNLFKAPIVISNFGDFKFTRNSATTGTATGFGDNYGGITITYNGIDYVTDGYGNAVAAKPENNKKYTVGVNSGITSLQLR